MNRINTKSGDILCVEIPEGVLNWQSLDITLDWSNHRILGKLSELTDKDCEEFVEYYQKERIYRNYIGFLDSAWDCGDSAKESFISLLQSKGIDTSKEYLIIKIFGQ